MIRTNRHLDFPVVDIGRLLDGYVLIMSTRDVPMYIVAYDSPNLNSLFIFNYLGKCCKMYLDFYEVPDTWWGCTIIPKP